MCPSICSISASELAASTLSSTMRMRLLWSIRACRRVDERQMDLEDRPVSGSLAACGDSPVVHLDQSLHDRQSDPETALRSVEGSVALNEQIEYPRQQLGRDSNTRVGYHDDGLLVLAAQLQTDFSARVGVLCRVGEHIGDALYESRVVAEDVQRLEAGADE